MLSVEEDDPREEGNQKESFGQRCRRIYKALGAAPPSGGVGSPVSQSQSVGLIAPNRSNRVDGKGLTRLQGSGLGFSIDICNSAAFFSLVLLRLVVDTAFSFLTGILSRKQSEWYHICYLAHIDIFCDN